MALGWTPFQSAIVFMMLVTGSINTLAMKWGLTISALNTAGENVTFNHPFLYAFAMFLGEFMCLGAFYVTRCQANNSSKDKSGNETVGNNNEGEMKESDQIEKGRDKKELKPFSLAKGYLLFPAAFADMIGICILDIAITFTTPSSYQMLMGAVIIFTGLNSKVFLKQRLEWYRWLGIFVAVAGLALIGVADLMQSQHHHDHHTTVGYIGGIPKTVVGDMLVILATLFISTQAVYEEKVLSKYSIDPLQAVGLEGFFGMILMVLALVVFNCIPTYSLDWGHSPKYPYYLEDALDGMYQLYHRGLLLFSFLFSVASFALFNFSGVTVTKELSATTRMVMDSARTMVVWVFSLALSWQHFHFLQPVGFFVLLTGICLYNDIAIRSGLKSVKEMFFVRNV